MEAIRRWSIAPWRTFASRWKARDRGAGATRPRKRNRPQPGFLSPPEAEAYLPFFAAAAVALVGGGLGGNLHVGFGDVGELLGHGGSYCRALVEALSIDFMAAAKRLRPRGAGAGLSTAAGRILGEAAVLGFHDGVISFCIDDQIINIAGVIGPPSTLGLASWLLSLAISLASLAFNNCWVLVTALLKNSREAAMLRAVSCSTPLKAVRQAGPS